MTKALLLAIILTVTLNLVSAVEFSFSAPNSIDLMEDFEVEIGSPSNETHDVKIFFKQSADTLQSEVMTQEGWKNAYYYLKSSFPEQYSYKARLKQNPSDDENIFLCVRLRKPNQNSYDEECKQVELKSQSKEPESDTTSETPQSSMEAEDEPYNISQIKVNESQEIQSEQDEPIVLRNPSKHQSELLTKQSKTRIFINYVLAFVVLIALFLVVKRHNREI